MATPKFVVWIRTYGDGRKRQLTERVIVSGEPPPAFKRFVLKGSVTVPFQDKEGLKEATCDFARQFHAESVEEAYELFDSELARGEEQAKRDTLAKLREATKRIVLPGPGNTPGPPPSGRDGRQRPKRR